MSIERFVVVGAGAIGGAVAAALSLSGHEVVAIARGAQLEAIRARGLTLKTPAGTSSARFECVPSPARIAFRPGDAILLAVKTQDTPDALDALRDAGVAEQPIFCLQNGVENERQAIRRFANVHGVLILMPVDYVRPGEVAAFGAPCHGIFDIGRYPDGSDEADEALAAALTRGNIASFVQQEVMPGKYGKLLQNLNNVVEAAVGAGPHGAPLRQMLRQEGEAALAAAGIAWRDVGPGEPRRAALMEVTAIAGETRTGSSSTQSLVRGAGSIETDWLNGEIVMLGRQHGVPTPANAYFTDLALRMVRDQRPAGSVPVAEVEQALGL